MFTITNSFTYIAFLMLLAGGLLALEKYAKWKVFNIIPPLVWIYVLNMAFCTMGLCNSEACSAAYGALKNNILYAMIFCYAASLRFPQAGQAGAENDRHFYGLCHYFRYRFLRPLSGLRKLPGRC